MQTLRAFDPSSVGQFRLLGRLGADGMGQTYLGADPDERRAAVTVVHAGLAHDERFRARFAHGVDVGRRVTAPWTAAVVDADPDAPQPWLATEYVTAPSLEHAVRSTGALPPGEVRGLAARLAQALAGIHEEGLPHGDVKPSNVLLTADGPRLIGFGIAHAVDAVRMASAGMTAGTPVFMSPEQAAGRGIGPASDVFSLGAVLVFAATGTGPFGDDPPPAQLHRVRTSPADLGEVAEPVRGLVARCLARDPAERPSAAEVAAALGPEPASGPAALAPPAAQATPAVQAPPAAQALPPRSDEAAARPVTAPPAAAPHPSDRAPAQAGSSGRRIGRRTLLTAATLVGLGGIGAAAAAGVSWATRPEPAVRWSYPASGGVLAVVSDGATVYATGTDLTVHAIDAATGRPRWAHAIGQDTEGEADSLAVAGSTVYTSDGLSTYAIDVASGARRWDAKAGDLLTADPTTVICAGHDGSRRVVSAHEPDTGNQRWTRRLEDLGLGAGSPPDLAALSGGAVHLVGGGTLVTLDLATGTTMWSRPVTGDAVPDGIAATPDTVFLTDPTPNSSDPDAVLALDVRTGAERWIADGSTDPGFAPRLVTGGTVYGVGSSEVGAFDAATGSRRWTWSDEVERDDPLALDSAWSLSGPTLHGDVLVILADTTPAGSRDSYRCAVIGLATKSGRSQWRLELPPFVPGAAGGALRKSGPVATADGSVVVSVGREVYAITA